MVAKTNADIEMLVHIRQAVQALNAMTRTFQRSMRQMAASTDQVNRKSKRANNHFATMDRTLKSVIMNSAAWLGTMGSIYGIVGLVRREIDAIADRQEQAKQSTLSFSEAMESIRFQTPRKGSSDIADMSAEDIRNAIMNADVVDKAAAARAVLGAISSDSTSPISQRVGTALELAELRPALQKNQAAMAALTEAVVGQKRIFGGTTKEQMMMVQLGQQVSRVTDTEQFAKYVGPAVEKLEQFGFTQSQAMALAAAYSSATVDPTGETTQTNLVKVMGQLYEQIRIMTGGKSDIKGMEMIELIQSKTDLGQRLRNYMIGVMQDELTPEQFAQAADFAAGKTKGRSAGKIAFFNLFQALGVGEEGTMKQALAAAIKQIPTDLAAAGREFAALDADRRRDPFFLAAKADQIMQSSFAKLETSPEEAARSIAINAIKELSKRTQGSEIEGRLSGFLAQLDSRELTGIDAMDLVWDTIRKRRNRMRKEIETGYEGTFLDNWMEDATGSRQTPIGLMTDERRAELRGLEGILTETMKGVGELVKLMRDSQGKPKLQQPKQPDAEAIGQ